LALATALLALCALVSSERGAADPLTEQHALEHKIADAKAHEQQLGDAIQAQSSEISSLQGKISTLGAELQTLEAKLAASRARLAQTQARLEDQTGRIELLRQDLEIARERLSQRLVDIYTGGEEPDLMALIIGAQSLDEVIEQVDLYSRVLEQDDALVAQVDDARTELVALGIQTQALEQEQAKQTQLVAEQAAARRDAYQSLVVERDRLDAMRSTREAALASTRVQRKEWEQEADALAAESAQVAAAATSGTAPTGNRSGLIWPVSGTVVSPFGMRWGRMHTGIDIAAPTGAPVVASASGRVTYAGWMSGYGLIVVIQHVGSIATAYAHNSSLAVSVGETVSQGQQIASVGCTGHCYGPHVHFEVRVNGTPVDPMGYL
jgi:murein DD-endopeptidase MepM/ murein hydrolase activator NlpD